MGADGVCVRSSIQLATCNGCTAVIDGTPAVAHRARKSPAARAYSRRVRWAFIPIAGGPLNLIEQTNASSQSASSVERIASCEEVTLPVNCESILAQTDIDCCLLSL
jgi:hypothetical protein